MTDLQKKSLNLLKEFLRITKELSLNYYLVCGSVLGAVKYQGFIPWDDDIDVGMPREDYDIFIREAPAMLKSEYFLANYHTEPTNPIIYSKLRDSTTTFIETSVKKMNINHGIYIDIFPLDSYTTKNRKEFELKKYVLQKLLASDYYRKSLVKKVAFGILKVIKKILNKDLICRYESMIKNEWKNEGDIICNHGNWQGNLEYSPKWHYGNGTWAMFEGIKVRIPENYDAYLQQKYGDWRATLPIEKQISHHVCEVCDVYKPYTAYIEKCSNGNVYVKQNKNI